MPRPRVGFVQAQASPTLSTPGVRGAAAADPVDHAAHRQHAGERLALEPVRVARQRADDRGERVGVAQPLERPVGGRGVERHRPGVAVPGEREHREAPEVGEPRGARRRHGAAEVARVVGEPRADGLVGVRLEPGRGEQSRQPRAAAHRVDDQVGRELGAAVRAHADHPCGPVGALPVSSRATPARRRTVSPGSASAIRASACSSTGRRTCSVRKRSSPGRGARSVIVGGM